MHNNLEIFENNLDHLDDFILLNEEWISTYFKIEDIDRQLAANPQQVIDDGGYIFSLALDNKVIGVCALFNHGNDIYELARMAVSPEHQGKGFGNQLIELCLEKARDIKASTVFLVSNTKLKPALSLYKKHGFKIVSTAQHPVYSRANIMMEIGLL
jgi:putative acetyltransferase